jgi:hypothetical protein
MYKPHRDSRFEYVWEVMEFIETRQCVTCAYKAGLEETPMCGPIENELIMEKPVADLDDVGDDGVVCRRYRDEVLVEQEHPDQGRLI